MIETAKLKAQILQIWGLLLGTPLGTSLLNSYFALDNYQKNLESLNYGLVISKLSIGFICFIIGLKMILKSLNIVRKAEQTKYIKGY